MITETTAISLIAMSLAGTTTFATVDWIYNLTWKRYWAAEAEVALGMAEQATILRDTWRSIAISLQERLDTEAAKRSSITSRGNLTKAANRKAAISATTNQLQREVAERAEPARIAA